jgi:ceramide glucosyltransferase
LFALLLISIAGLAGATVYLVLVLLAVRRFRRSPAPIGAGFQPAVTLLKPVHGDEPQLEQNLESFFQQRYPTFQLIFGARHANDPALRVVDSLRRRYPGVPVKVVLSGEPTRPNAKVCTLLRMVAEADHDHLIISDSDVHVGAGYIEQVIAPLQDPHVGMVTCLYRGVPTGMFWSRLEALGMSVEMTSGVLVAEMLEGMKFALGPTMATRKEVLQNIGGLEPLADYCSDDYLLGKYTAEAGYGVALSRYVIDHVVLNQTALRSIQHQARWMRSTRFSRQWGHIGTGMTFAIPFGILALVAGWATGHPILGASLFCLAVLNRVTQSVAAGWLAVRDKQSLHYCWLYPFRDLLGFLLWTWSFVGANIWWRGERYRLLGGGRMVRCNAPEASSLFPADLPRAEK